MGESRVQSRVQSRGEDAKSMHPDSREDSAQKSIEVAKRDG